MTGDITAAGDIATGALLGRAVEPRAGEADGHGHGVCLNCGTALIGDYCHVCGQSGHLHSTLTSIGHDLLHGAFHFEGKIWRTLPMLVLHPGALTRRYIAGERARFVSPLALFLFFVFLMFAVFHAFGGDMDMGELSRGSATREERVARIDGEIAATRAKLVRAQQKVAAGKGDEDTPDDITGYGETLKGLATARQMAAALPETTGRHDGLSDLHTGWARLDHGIAKANANPELALYKLQSAAYKYSWVMIPISVPFVALLFLWRRRFRLYDHTIFVTYSLSFMMLLTSVTSAMVLLGASSALYGPLMTFVPPVHIFAQLKGAYGLKRFSALWRTFALLIFGSITLVLFVLLLLGLGLME